MAKKRRMPRDGLETGGGYIYLLPWTCGHNRQERMRRTRSNQRGDRGDHGAIDYRPRERGKGHVLVYRLSPLVSGIAAASGVAGGTTVALKLHKYVMIGGSLLSTGAAAVITEDIIVFVALFGLWHLACRVLFAVVECGMPLGAAQATKIRRAFQWTLLWVATVLHWIFLGAFVLGALLVATVEHLFFLSTRSLLDGDALLVAKKSVQPIIFIALEVEGQRVLNWAMVATILLTPIGCVVYRLSLMRSTTRPRRRPILCGVFSECWRASRVVRRVLRAALSVPAVLGACAACAFVGVLVFSLDLHGDYRLQLLRRNCIIGIVLDVRSKPPAGGGDRWASAVVEAMSSRIIGGVQVGGGDGTVEARAIANTPGNENGGGREAVGGDEAVEERPNVVIVVLESTRGAFVTPADDVGVSPWAKKLSERGMSSTSFYSSMPNTNKAMYQVMCGMTPSLETSWVEFERPDVLEAVCLPGILRSKLGYKSLFLTASSVGGLGCLGFDEAIGYAGQEEQGGKKGFKKRKVHDKFSFKHGTFEKVNYLGYDDHVVLNRSISFLLGDENDGPRDQENAPPASAEGVRQERDGKNDRSEGGDAGGKLLTILTVGPHHFHDVPSHFSPDNYSPWEKASSLRPGQEGEMRRLLDMYLSALRYQDLFLENLYRQLDDTGLSKNTYVVVVGDHGEAFEEHTFNKHGNNVYQEGMLVPFFLTPPSTGSTIAPGKVLDRHGMHADIAPTVLDLLGLWKPRPRVRGALPGAPSPSTSTASPNEEDFHVRRPGQPAANAPRQEKNLRGEQQPAQKKDSIRRPVDDGAAFPPGSGLIGDSLIGPDERGCALGAVHYGGKTLAVVAGNWKGLFLFRWERHGDKTRAMVTNAQLFDLAEDSGEMNTLLREGAGGCCPMDMPHRSSFGSQAGSPVAASCHAAAEVTVPLPSSTEQGTQNWEEVFEKTCCHLQSAAIAFAGDNLRFFGRQARTG